MRWQDAVADWLCRTVSRWDLDLLRAYPYFLPKKLLREKIRMAAPHVGGTVLDLGCGDRPYRSLFPNVRRYVGMDLDPRRRPNVIGSAEHLPFRDGVADAVLCTEVLEHCPNPEAVLREIGRVLRPGGVLVLTTPMCWNLHYEPHDYFRFTRYGLALLAGRAGLRIVRVERIGGVFALCGARLTEVVCKTVARALKGVPRPIARLLVSALYLTMSGASLGAARLLDWVDRTDAIGWFLLAQREAAG